VIVPIPVEDRKSKKALCRNDQKQSTKNLNPYNAKVFGSGKHGLEAIAGQILPSLPLSTEEMDRIYALPFTRKTTSPRTANAVIPALDVVKDSVNNFSAAVFGGCAFLLDYRPSGEDYPVAE
jgi:hypothetical protein